MIIVCACALFALTDSFCLAFLRTSCKHVQDRCCSGSVASSPPGRRLRGENHREGPCHRCSEPGLKLRSLSRSRCMASPLCREPCVWTALHLVTSSGRGAGAAPTSGSSTRKAGGGATPMRTAWTAARRTSAPPTTGRAPSSWEGSFPTKRPSTESFTTGMWCTWATVMEGPLLVTGLCHTEI